MNKLLFGLLLVLTSFSFHCSELSNPFDMKSRNHFSDSTMTQLLQSYDSLIIDTLLHNDTVLLLDTVIHVDTSIYDSISFIISTKYDTTVILDTIIDSLKHFDTVIFTDTIIYEKIDTTYFRDTVIMHDTSLHYDTIFHLDTILDTLKFFRTTPFIYLINLSDSTVFNTYTYGSTYNLGIKAAGIDPSIIRGYSFKPDPSFMWNDITIPWVRSFIYTTDPLHYILRIDTDSGSFANSYVLQCDPSSALKGKRPVFDEIYITNLDLVYENFVPVCTLWVDSTPDFYGYANIYVQHSLPGCTRFEYRTSTSGSYDLNTAQKHENLLQAETLIELDLPLEKRVNIATANCRCTAPDTSQWSGWSSFVFIVRQKNNP